MKDLQCPYCNHDIDLRLDDGFGYDEDVKWQYECPSCEKSFYFTTTISISHEAFPAPCIDSGEHNFEMTWTIPRKYSRLRCAVCGSEKAATREEIEAIYPNAFEERLERGSK